VAVSDPVPIAEEPLGVIDLLDGAFAALRQRPRTMVAIVAWLVVPLSLFEAWLTRDDLGGATFIDLLNDPTVAQEVSESSSPLEVGILGSQLLTMFVTAVAGVAVARVVGGWLDGVDRGAGDALRFTARRSPVIVAAFVLIHLAELIGLVLLIIPGLLVIVLSALTSPVIALEGLGPFAAIRRSWTVARRQPGVVFGVVVLLAIVDYGVSQAIGTLPILVSFIVGPDRAWPIVAASNLLTSIILIPVTAAAMCLTYLDIRFRTEGLDLQYRIVDAFDDPTDAPRIVES
jgi:hypothetical protein